MIIQTRHIILYLTICASRVESCKALFSWRTYSHLTQIKKLAEVQKGFTWWVTPLKKKKIIVIRHFTLLYITKPNSAVSKTCLEALLLNTLNSCVDYCKRKATAALELRSIPIKDGLKQLVFTLNIDFPKDMLCVNV